MSHLRTVRPAWWAPRAPNEWYVSPSSNAGVLMAGAVLPMVFAEERPNESTSTSTSSSSSKGGLVIGSGFGHGESWTLQTDSAASLLSGGRAAAAAAAAAVEEEAAARERQRTEYPVKSRSLVEQLNPVRVYGPGGLPQVDMSAMDSCVVRAGWAGVAGAGLGLFFGLVLNQHDLNPNWETMSTKERVRTTLQEMKAASFRSAKNFGMVGAMYTVVECSIEKSQGKVQMSNAVAAGCATGGLLALRAGPKAACLGCAGFATFSALIELFMAK